LVGNGPKRKEAKLTLVGRIVEVVYSKLRSEVLFNVFLEVQDTKFHVDIVMANIQSAVLQECNDIDVVGFPDFVNYTNFVLGFPCICLNDFPGERLRSSIVAVFMLEYLRSFVGLHL
jgi:hypothetical protein